MVSSQPKRKNEDPKDFYQHIVNQINIHLEKVEVETARNPHPALAQFVERGLERQPLMMMAVTLRL